MSDGDSLNISARQEGFDACNAICPWLTTDFEPLDIEQKYSYSMAPHIVFVLGMYYDYIGISTSDDAFIV